MLCHLQGIEARPAQDLLTVFSNNVCRWVIILLLSMRCTRVSSCCAYLHWIGPEGGFSREGVGGGDARLVGGVKHQSGHADKGLGVLCSCLASDDTHLSEKMPCKKRYLK